MAILMQWAMAVTEIVIVLAVGAAFGIERRAHLADVGAEVRKVKAPFDPEGGAYGQHNHDLGHLHGPLHEDRHG